MNLRCTILHLEDSDDDSFFFQRALEVLSFVGIYRRVSRINDARSYLAGENAFSDRKLFPWPDVVVVDTCIPGAETTQQFLGWLSSSSLPKLQIVVLSGGRSPQDEESFLSAGATAILAKGTEFANFTQSVAQVLQSCKSPH